VLRQYAQELIEQRGKMEEIAVKNAAESCSSEFIPTKQYFAVLNWAVVTGGFQRDCFPFASDFVATFRRLCESGSRFAVGDCFSFIFEVARVDCDEFFASRPVFAKFIASFTSSGFISPLSTTINLIRIIPRNAGDDFFRSDALPLLCTTYFSDPNAGPDLSRLILAITTPGNLRILSTAIWGEPVFTSCFRRNAVFFFQVSWRVIKKFPRAANAFFDGDCHLKLWAFFRAQPQAPRALAKLIGVFNIAYVAENRDKKFFMRGSRNDSLVKKWREVGVDIPTLRKMAFATPTITQRVGAGGICRLLESFAVIDPGFCREIFRAIREGDSAFVARCPAEAQGSAAKTLTTVCLRVGERPEIVNTVIVREFAELCGTQPAFAVLDRVSQLLLSLLPSIDAETRATVEEALNRIFRTTKEVRMTTSSVGRLAFAASGGDVGAWMLNAANLLSLEVATGLTAEKEKLEAVGKNIHTLLDFIRGLAKKNGMQMPEIPVRTGDFAVLAGKFEAAGDAASLDVAAMLAELARGM
jgi:hypothetical protein